MKFDPLKPYNDLPPLPPKTDIETISVLRKAVAAGRALAELKGLGETIPDQSILVNSLILQEAKASSEIENVITTNDALFRAFSADTSQTDSATKEVLRYTKVRFLVDAGIAKRQTAAEYLKELEKIGVLKSHKTGKENLYLNVKLYELLSKQ